MKEYKYKINGKKYDVTIKDVDENLAEVEVNGNSYKIELEKPVKAETPKEDIKTVAKAQIKQTTAPAAATQTPISGTGKGVGVQSPLPGIIIDIKVKVGDVVKKGQTVLILEAMKMENNISASVDGTIKEIKINKGDSVLEGIDLVIIG
ncbi:MAG: biotin/lipoyl-containing protein [Bacteroidaceae bacterium]|nr:biotin/lipoyl-binding protein [Bacteroidaceae bacterium]